MKIAHFKSFISNRITIVVLFLIIGTLLRFYNLNWGAPFYFHPDERNIASAISQLHFPSNMNPHFFAYGTVPLYLVYFLGLFQQFLTICHFHLPCSVTFEQAIILSRFVSAFLSVLLIPLSFLIAEKVQKGAGVLTAALSTFSTGYIQFAHFGTVEMFLTFFSLLFFLTLYHLLRTGSLRWSLLSGIVLGILLGTKVSSIVLIILPLLVFLLQTKHSLLQKSIRGFLQIVLLFIVASGVFIITNPYVLLDTPEFINSMHYESSVGLGTLPVFYTGEFIHSIPILFQLLYVYPFLLNPLILLVFLVALLWEFLKLRKNKQLFLVLSFFFVIFLSQAFLFVKWTRYMVPTLPFIYLLVSFFILSAGRAKKFFLVLCLSSSIIFGVSYFITAFVEKDTRIEAVAKAQQLIPSSAPVLSEVYDLGIVPFNDHFPHITLFNTYELDNKNPEYDWSALSDELDASDAIILPSQRILKVRLQKESSFPIGNAFYKGLINQSLGFSKVYQTPCSLFCEIVYLGDPVNRFEETATVFDRPTVFIFKKL